MSWTEITDAQQARGIYEGIIVNGPRITLQEVDSMDAEQQFLMDMAMWYGCLAKQPDQVAKRWKHDAICRMFTLLLKGGLMVRRSNNNNFSWVTWRSIGGPVASVISHTARVVVLLPPTKLNQFWSWLWNQQNPQTRGAATHGIAKLNVPLLVYPKVQKSVKETKDGGTCDHFGINLALGGEGNRNPVSGNRIYPNGEHGHLYYGLSKNLINGRKALLIATEQSAPLDRYSGKSSGGEKHNFISKIGGLFGGVSDQYGGSHGLGGHNDRACNGGQDWTEKYVKKGKKNRLKDFGPGPSGECYIDGMLIDLTDQRFVGLKDFAFDEGMLGMTPAAP